MHSLSLTVSLLPPMAIDTVTIYCREEKQRKVLPKSQSIMADGDTLKRLVDRFGAANVKVV